MSTLPEVVLVSGSLTDEFSWFPGYFWRYVHCAHCNAHLGWKYFSRNLMPKSFLGLTGKSIIVEPIPGAHDMNDSSADELFED